MKPTKKRKVLLRAGQSIWHKDGDGVIRGHRVVDSYVSQLDGQVRIKAVDLSTGGINLLESRGGYISLYTTPVNALQTNPDGKQQVVVFSVRYMAKIYYSRRKAINGVCSHRDEIRMMFGAGDSVIVPRRKKNLALHAARVALHKAQAQLRDKLKHLVGQRNTGAIRDEAARICAGDQRIVFVDSPWRPGDIQQVESRIDREGAAGCPVCNYEKKCSE